MLVCPAFPRWFSGRALRRVDGSGRGGWAGRRGEHVVPESVPLLCPGPMLGQVQPRAALWSGEPGGDVDDVATHLLRPAGQVQQSGELGDPRPVAEFDLGALLAGSGLARLVGGGPRRRRQLREGGVDVKVAQVRSQGEPDPCLREVGGAAGRAAAPTPRRTPRRDQRRCWSRPCLGAAARRPAPHRRRRRDRRTRAAGDDQNPSSRSRWRLPSPSARSAASHPGVARRSICA